MGLFIVSNISYWSYEHGPATVWPTGGTDDWGQPIGGTPYLIPRVGYQGGGDLAVDANGTEFTPSQTFGFEMELDDPQVPQREWYIKLGDHTALPNPPNDAERIRAFKAWPIDELEPGGIPDWQVMT